MPQVVPHNPAVKPLHIPYTAYPLQDRVHEDPSRIRVVNWGRRSGKSLMAVIEGFRMSFDLYWAQVKDIRGFIAAPTNEMLRENWWTANKILKEVIAQPIISEHRLLLKAGLGQIDFKSTEAQGGAGRGGGYNWGVIDEASRVPKDAWESDLRPALSDRRGRALIISTPKGLNWFFDLHQQGKEGDPDIKSWQATTMDCWRSRLLKQPEQLALMEQEWELIRRTTSESRFREEYLAEFLQDQGQHFTLKPDLFRGVLREAIPGRHYLAGVDVARKEDWMATTIIEEESQQLVALVRSRHQDWALQKAHAIELIHQYPDCLTHIDSTGVGDPIAHDLREAGVNAIDVIFTPKIKGELVENLTIAIEQAYIGIPQQAATEWLIDELKQYESKRMPSGTIRYGAPEGKHDDGVTSLMLACFGLKGRWHTPKLDDVIESAWWQKPGKDWEALNYEHEVKSFRRRFPGSDIPVHPTDLAWHKVGAR